MLSFLARFSWFRVHIDTDKCNGCHLCERSCKAACIDAANHTVDYSRCVTCGNCIDKCRRHAISYTHMPLREPAADTPKESAEPVDTSRRSFLVGAAIATSAAALAQEKKKIDGGLAVIEDKVAPKRLTPITRRARSRRRMWQSTAPPANYAFPPAPMTCCVPRRMSLR